MTGVVCTPLRTEWLAVSPGLSGGALRTGRSRSGEALPPVPRLVTGVAGALTPEVAPGDLVVATEVRDATTGQVTPCPAAPLLLGALRRAGHPVHLGPVVTTEHVVDDPAERARLAAPADGRSGALAVDTESSLVLAGAPEGQAAVVRAIVDTPDQRLFSLGTAPRGLKALASLRRAARVLEEWVRATGDRELVLASPRSFCAGVERAIDIVERALGKFGEPVYVRRQIVHNRHVVAELERKGAVFVEEVEEVPEGSVVVLAAHGVTPAVRLEAEERRLRVVDATCPLVMKVHNEVRRFATLDHTVFLIGHADHEEVVGTIGEAPGNVVVVNDPDEAMTVEAVSDAKVSYVMQTTLAVDEAEKTATILRERFPALNAPRKDDICYATTNRQQAVRTVARTSDLVIVLGSHNSSNSQRLVEVARGEGTPAYLVDDLSDVDLGWLPGIGRVGITAGASAPPHLVEEVIAGLAGLGRVSVQETETVSESVRFTLPREVS